ncbi:MAG: HlyD family efflux transporter periplasmic adaptor subunit [Bryobacterales bacterium]|nr:HlyD family efflux transporter periplasmic adaptor subunit [Bryobacterales bacterium]
MATHAPPAKYDALPILRTMRSPNAALVLARMIFLLVLITALVLIFVPWQQSIPGSGRVIAFAPVERQQFIDAPVDGRIRDWKVVEGARVRTGDLLLELVDNDPNVVESLRAQLIAEQARLNQAIDQATFLSNRINQLQVSRNNAVDIAKARVEIAEDQVRAAEQALEAAKASRVAAKQNIDRQKQLVARGLTSIRNVELAEADILRTAAEVERSEAALAAARRERITRIADVDKILADNESTIDSAKAAYQSALSTVETARATIASREIALNRQNTLQVTAPRDGTIFRIIANQGGEFVKSGDSLAVLVPETGYQVVELYVSGNDMPLINRGDLVRLQFEGWPAIQFVGWPSVAVGTFGGKVLLVDPTDNGTGQFRVLIEFDETDDPWPSNTYLRQGVRANGWVLLNQVPLGFELWRQFNGFPPVIAPDEPGAGMRGAKSKGDK